MKVRTLQRYYKFKKKYKKKNKWKEKGTSIEMGRWEDRKKIGKYMSKEQQVTEGVEDLKHRQRRKKKARHEKGK